MKGHIRTSTVVLIAVIAMLVGALGVTIHSRSVPEFMNTAQAATTEAGPLVSFAPVVKRAMPAVVNISSSKVVKEQHDPRAAACSTIHFSVSFSAAGCPNSSSPVRSGRPAWARA